jgi:tyrosyl-tRNA synthetase
VQKMSKSYGNYIGISEPPQEIYGKVMSISDELMWRYYELLTDVKVPEIEQMKTDVASGKQHPMQIKKALARRIVQDFHGEQAAVAADENWAKQFQKDENPEDLEKVSISLQVIVGAGSKEEIEDLEKQKNIPCFPDRSSVMNPPPGKQQKIVRLDKMLLHAGLAESTSDANRKLKQNAVKIDSKPFTVPNLMLLVPADSFVARVGSRLKRVQLVD